MHESFVLCKGVSSSGLYSTNSRQLLLHRCCLLIYVKIILLIIIIINLHSRCSVHAWTCLTRRIPKRSLPCLCRRIWCVRNTPKTCKNFRRVRILKLIGIFFFSPSMKSTSHSPWTSAPCGRRWRATSISLSRTLLLIFNSCATTRWHTIQSE